MTLSGGITKLRPVVIFSYFLKFKLNSEIALPVASLGLVLGNCCLIFPSGVCDTFAIPQFRKGKSTSHAIHAAEDGQKRSKVTRGGQR